MTMLWWHWLSFGLVLISAELFIPSFTIIWFGLGACFVGLYLYLFPESSLTTQLFIWTLASTILTFLWFRVLRPKMVDKTTAGMSQEAILGEAGMVVKSNATQLEKGRVRFTLPVLGAEEWDYTSAELLQPGDYVRVTGIDGHVLKVDKK
jgi:membrane protein implicated in regulation of membrane protease activity